MALGNPVDMVFADPPGGAFLTVPVSIVTGWQTANSAPATANNGGSTVTDPLAITAAAQRWINTLGKGTSVLIALLYPSGASVSTNVVIQAFGRDTAGIAQRLVDKDGTHELTLTTASSDVVIGTSKITYPVEVDAQACKDILIAVKTALAGTTISGATILVRMK